MSNCFMYFLCCPKLKQEAIYPIPQIFGEDVFYDLNTQFKQPFLLTSMKILRKFPHFNICANEELPPNLRLM